MNEINDPASQILRGDSLISSVGFHTMSKQLSSNSSVSSLSSKSTLNRVIRRNYSQSSLLEKQSVHRRSIDNRADDALLSRNHKSNFFSSRGFLRSRSSQKSKSLQTVEDTASTSSKWPTEGTVKSKKAMDSLESPSLSNDANSQSKRPSFSSPTEDSAEIKNVSSRSTRHAGVSFSSQKSNSILTDRRMASLFYFSQGYLSEEGITPNVDSSRFQEIQRKYLASADQYMQSRLQKATIDDESSRPGTRDVIRVTGTSNQISKRYEGVFSKLFEMVKPILLPSKLVILASGQAHPVMEFSLDRVIRFVEDEILHLIEIQLLKSHGDLQYKSCNNSTILSKDAIGVLKIECCEETIEKLLKNLQSFFTKCLTVLASDLKTSNDMFLKQHKNLVHDDSPILLSQRYVTQWTYIKKAWLYFNSKIRFFFLNAFFYLQKSLYQLQETHSKFRDHRDLFDLNALLIKSFKTVFIIPQLKQRYKELEKYRKGLSQAAINEFMQGETIFLQKDNSFQGKAIARIFGYIAMQSQVDLTSLEEMSLNDSLFYDFHMWLNDLTR